MDALVTARAKLQSAALKSAIYGKRSEREKKAPHVHMTKPLPSVYNLQTGTPLLSTLFEARHSRHKHHLRRHEQKMSPTFEGDRKRQDW